jgi:hypothetical protein
MSKKIGKPDKRNWLTKLDIEKQKAKKAAELVKKEEKAKEEADKKALAK